MRRADLSGASLENVNLSLARLDGVKLLRLHHDTRTTWPAGFPIPPGALKVAEPGYAIMQGFEAGGKTYARVIDSRIDPIEKFSRHQEVWLPPESEPGHPVRLGPLIYAMTGPSEEVEIFEQDMHRAAAQPGPEAFTPHGSLDFEWTEHVSHIIAAMRMHQRMMPPGVTEKPVAAAFS